jgi:hypothetical protein
MMAKDPDQVSIEELVISNMYSIEAVVMLLIDKGILTQEEIVDKIKDIKQHHSEKRKLH